MHKIGIGIIGWGFMGRTHAQALRGMKLYYPDAPFAPEIRSVCSRRLEAAREAADALGAAHFTDDYRALLARRDIQAVSICTPNDQHERMALDALAAGKHVYIDKPLTVDGASALRVARAAQKSGLTTQMALNNRFWPSTLRAKALMDEGRIGKILSFQCRYLHSGSVDPDRPAGWKQLTQGGVLLDLGSHALDLMTWLCGWPEQVFCTLRTLYPSRPLKGGGRTEALSEDHALMLLCLPGGALGSVEASKIATGAQDELSFEIYGTRGALRWNLMEADWLEFYDNTLPEADLGGMRGFTRIECVGRFPAPGGVFLPPKNRVGWDRAHMHCYFSFLDALAAGRPAVPGICEGARLQLLMDALLNAHKAGAWTPFEPGI